MSQFLAALLAGLAISLMALIGFWSVLIAEKRLARFLLVAVPFAAGALLGGAFFHLLPESVESGGPTFPLVLVGILVFFVLDSLLWMYHCHGGHRLHHDEKHEHHNGPCPVKPVGVLNLVGDALHNITDGIVVGSAFLVSLPLGFATAFAVALHEIPQEVSDFGILLHSGFEKRRALRWNFLIALTILAGIIIVFAAQAYAEFITLYTIPFAAGGFIYMACANLIPEIREEGLMKKRATEFAFMLAGVALLWAMKLWLE